MSLVLHQNVIELVLESIAGKMFVCLSFSMMIYSTIAYFDDDLIIFNIFFVE